MKITLTDKTAEAAVPAMLEAVRAGVEAKLETPASVEVRDERRALILVDHFDAWLDLSDQWRTKGAECTVRGGKLFRWESKTGWPVSGIVREACRMINRGRLPALEIVETANTMTAGLVELLREDSRTRGQAITFEPIALDRRDMTLRVGQRQYMLQWRRQSGGRDAVFCNIMDGSRVGLKAMVKKDGTMRLQDMCDYIAGLWSFAKQNDEQAAKRKATREGNAELVEVMQARIGEAEARRRLDVTASVNMDGAVSVHMPALHLRDMDEAKAVRVIDLLCAALDEIGEQ